MKHKIGAGRRCWYQSIEIMCRHRVTILVLCALFAVFDYSAGSELPGPAGPEEGPFRKQRWLLPSPEFNVLMRSTVYRPRGAGPFPLVIISHGSHENAAERATYGTPAFDTVASWFVRQGYAVVAPQRPGHGETGGGYRESIQSCDFPNYQESAFEAAASIESTVLFMMTYPFIRKGTVVLVGQSTGALASLALTIRWPRMARSVILFAAGSGGRAEGIANQNCAPERLIRVIQEFGAKIRIPTLWMYVRNDTYFGPELSRRMVDGFRAAGGRAEYHVFPAFSDEGHFFIHSPQAMELWAPVLKGFLMRNN